MIDTAGWGRRARPRAEAPSPGAKAAGEAPAPGLAPGAARADPRLTRVGVFWSAGGVGGPTDAFLSSGKHVAAATWTQALARHSGLSSVEIFTPFAQLAAARQQLQGLPEGGAGRAAATTRVFPETALLPRFQRLAYDAVHVPLGLDLTQAAYLRAHAGGRLFPVTCSQHGISYSFDLFNVFLRLLSTPFLPCDALVCLTKASRFALEKRLGDLGERYSRVWERPAPPLPRLALIPWGVDTERFAPQDPGAARRMLDLPPDRPILLCVGRLRLEDKMDWTPLLLAFDRVRRQVSSSPLLVLAGANSSDYGEQLLVQAGQLGLQRDVRTFFNLPPACLPALYAACDIFVSPSDSVSESFGLTILEAMASGKPVVASDWDGYQELIIPGETGFKVRCDWVDCLGELEALAPLMAWDQQHLHVGQSVAIDVGQMAQALVRLLNERDLREAMGRAGRARVEAHFAWPKVIGQWQALWAELGGIARSLAGDARAAREQLEYLQPRYFAQFGHYASRVLDDATPVRLTARGRRQLSARGRRAAGGDGFLGLLLHPRARGLLDLSCLEVGLAILKPAAWLKAPLPLGKVVAALQQRAGLSRDRALMHLMWLAKYDLIAFGGEE